MANRHRGQAALKVGDQTYALVFDINAMCEVEYLLDMPTDAILSRLMANPPLHVVRALLWGGLRRHHGDIALSAAGDLIEEAGGAGAALEAIGAAMQASFPSPEPEAASGDKGKLPGGTGLHS